MIVKGYFLELISVGLLIIACLVGWFDIPSTLFYIACEVIICTLLIAVLYLITKRAERLAGIVPVIFFISVIVFFSASLPATMTNTYQFEISFKESLPTYLIDMLKITWPLLLVRIFFGVLDLKSSNKDDKEKENNLFKNLIVALFTSMGIGLLCVFLYKSDELLSPSIVLLSLILARILALFYNNKKEFLALLQKKT